MATGTESEVEPAKGKAASGRKAKTAKPVAQAKMETETKAADEKPKRAARKTKPDGK